MSASKSLFNSQLVSSSTRCLYNPISLSSGSSSATVSSTDLVILNDVFYKTMQIVENLYVRNMALKKYENIPSSYSQYVGLYATLQKLINRTSSKQLLTLFHIAQDALTGAINTYTIYSDNLYLQLDNRNLTDRINSVLSPSNQKLVQMADTAGNITMKQTFKLAAVFNNYILIYGLPAKGVGFDPVKVAFLAGVLTKNGIDPYA